MCSTRSALCRLLIKSGKRYVVKQVSAHCKCDLFSYNEPTVDARQHPVSFPCPPPRQPAQQPPYPWRPCLAPHHLPGRPWLRQGYEPPAWYALMARPPATMTGYAQAPVDGDYRHHTGMRLLSILAQHPRMSPAMRCSWAACATAGKWCWRPTGHRFTGGASTLRRSPVGPATGRAGNGRGIRRPGAGWGRTQLPPASPGSSATQQDGVRAPLVDATGCARSPTASRPSSHCQEEKRT